MPFTLHLLQEKSCEQQTLFFVAFVNLQKTFNVVSGDGIYKILLKTGCPQKAFFLFKEFHEEMKGTIWYENETSSEFSIDTAMKQGYVLVSTGFGIFFTILLKYAFGNDQFGVLIESRMGGSLFNIRQFQSKRHVAQHTSGDMLFTDGTALVSNSAGELQIMMNKLSEACMEFGVAISIKKTVVMLQGTNTPPKIYVNNETLDSVDHFCYLGSTLTSSLSLDRELDVRIGSLRHLWETYLMGLAHQAANPEHKGVSLSGLCLQYPPVWL
ncbi:hypothetical protein Y1Q_0001952 [Alligator mississippiensis]|uniref:Reverse transcriptase domain-containing protein n=1 Tax=Alligator mississippiensis TaxID=8496 RepID=A0A151PGJ6_ALLMI|nr:hypothetical protein Y1Q_0001952 [Alligator mississippiensis]